MRLRAVPYEVPFRRPIRTAHGTMSHRQGWWIVLEDGRGPMGLGEVAPLPAWGTETFSEAAAALDRLTELDLSDLDRLVKGLSRTPAVAAGVELAGLDALAREKGVPMAALLASEPLSQVAVNALLTATRPEELAQEAHTRVEEGYRTLKVKVGYKSIEEDVRRLRALREAVGSDVSLRADANGAWAGDQAVHALECLQPFELEYLEQPTADASELATLRDRRLVPIAADESALDPVAIQRLIANQSADWLILKPMALGGMRITWDLADLARKAGIQVTLTSVLDRGQGLRGALHLAAALGIESACGLGNTHLAPEHFVGPVPERGVLAVSTATRLSESRLD